MSSLDDSRNNPSHEGRFVSWLETEPTDDMQNELLWWLATGSGRGRHETAPSEFILTAMGRNGNEPALRHELALRIGKLLDACPDLRPRHPMAEEAMVHLLLVAQRLGMADELGPSLWGCYSVVSDLEISLSLSLSTSLLAALLYNPVRATSEQISLNQPSLSERTWMRILEGQSDPILGGLPEVAINGIFLLRSPVPNSGRPDFDAVGRAIIPFAKHCERKDRRNRVYLVRAALRRFRDLWQISDAMAFIKMAHNAAWHTNGIEWALITLPTLFSDFGLCKRTMSQRGQSDLYQCVVWHKSMGAIKALTGELSGSVVFCGENFQMVEVPEEFHPQVSEFLVDFEKWWTRQCDMKVSEGELMEALRSRVQIWEDGFRRFEHGGPIPNVPACYRWQAQKLNQGAVS